MIVDVHAHVYADPKIKSGGAATTFMSAEDQIAVMDRLGVDKTVILPLNNAECPAEPQSIGEVLWVCDQYPGRFIPFCNVDPRAMTNSADAPLGDLLRYYQDQGCKGLGEFY